MDININALALALSITNLMQVFIMFSQYRKSERKSGAGWWTLWALCSALAFAAYDFRNSPPPFNSIAVFLNNTFFVLALASIYTGLRTFFSERKHVWKHSAFILVTISLFAIFSSPGSYSYPGRRTVLLISVAMIAMPSGLICFRNREKTDINWANALTLTFVFAGMLALLGAPTVLVFERVFGMFENEVTQSGVYFVTLIASIIWTFGFFSMLNHRINQNIVEAHERFELIFKDGPDAVLMVALPEKIIENINEAFSKLLGFEADETIGKSLVEADLLLNVKDREKIDEILNETGFLENFQTRLKTQEGKKVTVLLSAKRVDLEKTSYDLYVFRDITQRESDERKIKKAQEQYRLLFENTLEVVLVAQAGRIKLVNPAIEKMSGYKPEELLNLPVLKFVYPEDHGEIIQEYMWRKSGTDVSDKSVGIRNFRVVNKNSEIKWAEMKTMDIEWEGKPATLNFISDVSEREKAIIDMLESESKYRLVAEFATDVIWVYNLTRDEMVYISPSVKVLRGFSPEEAIEMGYEGAFTKESLPVAHYSMQKNFENFKNSDRKFNSYTTELQQVKKDGSSVWVEESVRYRYNSDGEAEAIGVTRNIEERKGASESILYLSYHDQLTGLKNRRHYDEVIDELNQEDYLPLSLLMADVNGLKMTNDAFGHRAGDEILVKVANILKENCRDSDQAIRMGGDEFVILLPKTDHEQSQAIRERIAKAMEADQENTIGLSVSMGIATKTDLAEKFEDLFRRAEDDMYRHKLSESSSLRSSNISLIMNTLYEKNNREMLHSKRVGELCETFAHKLQLKSNEINQLRLAGLMHDIGKIGIEEKLLNSSDVLTDEERKEVERHSEIGFRILSSVSEFSEIAHCVLEHHERWDGKGYPRGLAGEEISRHARIIALADSYDAMTSKRAYRDALSNKQAAMEIKKNAGSQFDPALAKVFVEEVLQKSWD